MQFLLSGLEWVNKGGFMMYPLLLSGLIGLTIMIERFYLLFRVYPSSPEAIGRILNWIEKNDLQAAHQAASELGQSSPTPISSVLLAGISSFNQSPADIEFSMKNRAEAWLPLLEKRMEWIDTVITAAPLMGLLGTITGMMSSFQVLSEKGVNEPNAITGGVAEALIATATGLIIALICLVAYNLLSARVRSFVYDLETMASRVLEAKRKASQDQHKP